MIRSMTGYGMAQAESPPWSVRVEVRSVNHGELRTTLRLPETMRLRESELIELVRKAVARGYVTVDVCYAVSQEDVHTQLLDRKAMQAYLRLAREVSAAEGVPLQVELGSLLSLPGVMEPEGVATTVRERLWPLVLEASQAALARLGEMRAAEGQSLAREMEAICARIRRRVERVEERAQECVRAQQARLRERVAALLEGSAAPVDEEALAREVAFLAERGDVSEELARMKSHLAQFRAAMDSDEPAVGKKLEFLAQEMLREANTMAAKLPAAELVHEAVEVKADVQRLREQARNVE